MKRIVLILSLICLIIFSSAASASATAVAAPDPDGMAVLLNNDFSGQSAAINGSLYTANGNVTFNNAGDNNVTGYIYHKTGTSFTIPPWYTPDFANRVVALDSTSYNAAYPSLIDTPNISNYVANLSANSPVTISQNTHYGNLTIGSDIIVDTSAHDITLVVDTLTDNWNGKTGYKITLQGSGKLFLFINRFNNVGPLSIENGSNPDRTYIVAGSSLSNAGLNLYAHVFYKGISSLTIGGKITGSVVTDAASLTITGGDNVVNGLMYAPNANATISSPGTDKSKTLIPNITGRLVAKSLNMNNAGWIKYDPAYASLGRNIPAQLKYHTVTVRTNNAEGGTVSPTSQSVAYGAVITITATPNEGYRFTGFTSSDSSMIPDGSGNLTVTGSVAVTANFEQISGDFVNGILGEYYDASEFDNDSALKMKRIDSGVAFNFLFGSPDPVIEPETFAIRWTGYIRPQVSGNYTFETYSDDGVKVTVGGTPVIDRWGALSLDFTVSDTPVYLQGGQYYPITVEYQQLPIYAGVFLFWETNGVPMSLVPESAYYVTTSVYSSYATPQYYNQVEGDGSGFNNVFYTLDENGDRAQETSETGNIYYNWGQGAPGSITDDIFYGEMNGWLEARFTEPTTLVFYVDDSIRVWVGDETGKWFNNGDPVIDDWSWNSFNGFEYTFNTVAGHKYRIRIEYMDKGLGASCVMSWKSDSITPEEVVPAKFMYAQ